ncbi:hypothetical protein BX616_010711 [Lobosporangium transversale]|uniref:Major facilitator superfamily domain-containing protein n=1 Tax=Lobosporangium transversale TaxID=64571 RepID=A0A1Y2GX62_9FUNG|nr:major facilitator superfamily domain-containing protein [Lobosporangium transversale]KAF9910996.1 hypothetical protein BX616_010711 [Lobosporangium transversale]ORZ21937.1 major facilitator superfamily domain-containing protein [Lobosporangium transversale]|eukprot:XP_021883188.1 major facilitator superfamily domain-containing protein [Lobosporangium transversale]
MQLTYPANKVSTSARAASFLAACAVALVSGTPYLYSTYANQLTSKLSLNAIQSNIVGAGVHYGLFLSGPLFGRLVDIRGPRAAGIFAAGLLVAGYSGLALTYSGLFNSFGFFTAFFFLIFVGMGSQAGYMTAVSTNAHNFHSARGIAMGVPIACFGLSALLFAQINNQWFKHDTQGFLLLVAKLIGSVILCSILFLRIFPGESDDDIDPEAVAAATHQHHHYLNNGHSHRDEDEDDEAAERRRRIQEQQRLLPPNSPRQSNCSSHSSESTVAVGQPQHVPPSPTQSALSGFKLFTTAHVAKLLFLSILFLSGPGLMYVTNAGNIIRSIYRDRVEDPTVPPTEEELLKLQQLQNYHVSLISLCSCLGRISVGLMSDVGKRGNGRWWGINRIGFLLYAGVCVWLGQTFGAAVTEIEDLAKVSILVGLGYGSVFGVAPTIVSEWFGVGNFGTNWGWISVGNAIGGQFFNLLFGTLYDLEAQHEQTLQCFGIECFHTSFVLGTCSTFLGVAVLAYLTYITRRTY